MFRMMKNNAWIVTYFEVYSNPSKYTTLKLYEFEVYEWMFCYQKLDLYECHLKCTSFKIILEKISTFETKMLEYYNQFLKTFKVRLKIDWILGLDYFWVWISKNFSEILLLLFDFYWYKLLWIWTHYYMYSISMYTNLKCTTFSAARKLVYFKRLLYKVGQWKSTISRSQFTKIPF